MEAHAIFVQSYDRSDAGCISLKERAKDLEKIKNQDDFARTACAKWLDVRSFGQVFTFKGFGCASVGVRGPVSIHQAVSIDPVNACTMQITKSVS
ncbi:MAG: type I CRISPR-associated protein Cas7, partial [Aristaeellaceae bacterium]